MSADNPGTLTYEEAFAIDYRNWLLNEMRADGYSILFDHLYNVEFKWIIERDEHRALDGQNLRLKFEDITGRDCPPEWEDWPCSFLEMVVALAYSIEDSIMYDPEMGDRASEWFWMILTNLGLHICSDKWFGQEGGNGLAYVDDITRRVLNRAYDYSGYGGMFPLRNPDQDQRKVEIWYQANNYILEQELC